jgi:hypothetical protein
VQKSYKNVLPFCHITVWKYSSKCDRVTRTTRTIAPFFFVVFMEVRKAIIIEARRFGPLLLSEFRIIIITIILFFVFFWVWDFSVALALYHISLVQAVRWIKSLGGKGDRASSEFWTLNWTDSGWCSRALTGRSREFRPTAAAGQFQCASNLCFEFGMQKWKTRVFILHFLNFETLVAIIFTLRKIFETHRRPIHSRCIQHLQCW